MTDSTGSLDFLLFAVLPYVALALLVWGTIERLRLRPYTVSSGSSQFLENRRHFWTVVPFHYGIIVVLIGHLAAFAMPRAIAGWNAEPARLYALEITGLVFGLLAMLGFAGVVIRRLTIVRVRVTTQAADWVVYAILLLQLASGVGVAVAYMWGSAWSTAVLSPYLWSLVLLRPDISVVAALPLGVKVHVAGAFMLAAVFPFSRLVHIVTIPNSYFLRRPQVVRWYRPQPRRVGGMNRGY